MSQNWLSISPTSGRGNTQMTITAEENFTGEPRRAKIVITAGTLTKMIDVIQYPSDGQVTCTYVVGENGTLKLLATQNFVSAIVYNENGDCIEIRGTGLTTDYDISQLNVVEGDIVTVVFYKTAYHFLPATFSNVNVKTIKVSEGVSFEDNSAYSPFAHLPYLETIDLPLSVDFFYGSNNYPLVVDCPKLSAFTGESPLILDSRTLVQDGCLIGVALYGIDEYVVPSSIADINLNVFALTTATTATAPTIKSIVFTTATTAIHTTNLIHYVDYGAFQNNTSLTGITFHDGIVLDETNRNDYMFSGCTALTSVNIPSGWTEWKVGMFYDCSSLKSLVIPESVTTIGSVFSGCSSLTAISATTFTKYVGGTLVSVVNSSTFQGIATGGTLYHPDGTDTNNWLSTNEYYLGYYLWKDGIPFNLENVSTYYLQFQGNVSGSGFSQSVFITANKSDYEVVLSSSQNATGGNVTWLSVSGTPATGYTEFKVYPTSTTETQRSGFIHIVYNGRIYGTISVMQLASTQPVIQVDKNTLTFYSGDTGTFHSQQITVSTNVVYEISGTTSWLTISGTPATGMTTITVYPNSENSGDSARTTTFNLVYSGDVYQTINVTQMNSGETSPYWTNLTPTSLTFADTATSSDYQTVVLSTNFSQANINVTNNNNWLTCYQQSSVISGDVKSVTYRVYPNSANTSTQRTGSIIFTLSVYDGTRQETLSVTQQAAYVPPTPAQYDFVFVASGDGTHYMTIEKEGNTNAYLDMYVNDVYVGTSTISGSSQQEVFFYGDTTGATNAFAGVLRGYYGKMYEVGTSDYITSVHVYDKVTEFRVGNSRDTFTAITLDSGTFSFSDAIMAHINYISGTSQYITSDHRKCIGRADHTYACLLPSDKGVSQYGSSWNGQWTYLCYAVSGISSIEIPNGYLLWGFSSNDMAQKNYGIESFTLPYTPIPAGILFDGWGDLTSVTLNCAFIHSTERMFYGCTGLTSVSLPYIEYLTFYTFYNSSITSITFQDDVESVSQSAFYNISQNGVIHYSSRLNSTVLNAMMGYSLLSTWTFVQDVS